MPININWTDENRNVVIIDLRAGDWDWNEYDIAMDQATEMFNSVDHDIAVMLLSTPALPKGNAISHAQRAMNKQPSQVKLYVLVGGNMFTRTMSNILMRLYPKMRIVFTSTVEDGYKLAAENGFEIDAQSADAIHQNNA